jgi:hypothetical protein
MRPKVLSQGGHEPRVALGRWEAGIVEQRVKPDIRHVFGIERHEVCVLRLF